eukprot:6519812-Ditylum_brightwellii.AAC.2
MSEVEKKKQEEFATQSEAVEKKKKEAFKAIEKKQTEDFTQLKQQSEDFTRNVILGNVDKLLKESEKIKEK